MARFTFWCAVLSVQNLSCNEDRFLSVVSIDKHFAKIILQKYNPLFSFQCTDFQQIFKHWKMLQMFYIFLHLSNLKIYIFIFGDKINKYICSPPIFVLKLNSGWIFTAKLQTLEKIRVSICSPNAVFIRVAQLHCCASDPLFLRCPVWEMPASKCSKMRNYCACLTNQK